MTGPLVAFAESPEQAAAAPADALVVAMNALVDYACERAGRRALSIEALAPESAFHALGDDGIDRVERLCDHVDGIAATELAACAGAGDVSMRAFFHYLKTNIDGVLIRIEQVWRALETLAPAEVIAFRMPPYAISGITSFDKPATGLASRLVPAVAALRDVGVRWIEHPLEQPLAAAAPASPAPASSAGLPPPRRMPPAHRAREWVGRLTAGRRRAAPAPSGPLLLHALFEDLGTSIPAAWSARGHPAAALEAVIAAAPAAGDPTRRARCDALAAAVLADPDVDACLEHRGVRFLQWIAPLLELVLRERYPDVLDCAVRADAVLQGKRDAVIIAGGLVDRNFAIARAARRHGVPFVSHHYGGFLGFSLLPTHERYDMAECDYFVCGGPESRNTFLRPSPLARWRAETPRARPVALGLPWVEEAVHRQPYRVRRAERPRAMVVVNATVGDCRYLGYVFPPEIAYWRFLRRLVEALQSLFVDVLLKLPLPGRYPQVPSPVVDWLRDRPFEGVRIARDAPLSECLGEADAFVLESPSTPLLHVLATDAPLLLYADRETYRLVPRARELLERRCAVFAEREEDFFTRLGAAGARAFVPDARAKDTSFREAFLTGKAGTPATARITDFLARAASTHPIPDERLGELSQ